MGIFLEGEDFRGDHGLGRLVEFGFKAPPGTTSSSITTHTPSGQGNCASWASQPQKSVTLLPCPGQRTTKSTKGHVVAFEKYIYIYIYSITFSEKRAVCEIMWKNMVEPDRPQMTVWRTCIVCWITETADTHLECVIIIAFPRREWLRERALMLRYTYSTWPIWYWSRTFERFTFPSSGYCLCFILLCCPPFWRHIKKTTSFRVFLNSSSLLLVAWF